MGCTGDLPGQAALSALIWAAARIAAFPRQALHARRLGFTHPVDGRPLSFDSALPGDLHDLFTNLEGF